MTLILVTTATAQQVIMAPPQQPLVAPIMRQSIQDQSSISSASATEVLGPFLTVGQFQLRPHLFTSYVHADGLPVQGTTRVSSKILTFAPGLLADIGPHWTFDYTATSRDYSAGELRDTIDHDVRLVGANKSPDWGLQFTESYSINNAILIETAQQTKQKTWINALSADHTFGNLLRYQGTASLTTMDSANLPKTRDWATDQWLHVIASARVEVGLGLGLGYTDIEAQPDSRYEKYLGSLNWRPTDRINLSVQGGWENWHSQSAAIGSERDPILLASLSFQPIDQTRITIAGSRTVRNTMAGDGVTTSEGWNATLNQRLWGLLFLRLSYNHDATEYRAPAGSPLLGRSDRVTNFDSALAVRMLKYWTVSATYQSSKNDSNLPGFQYTSHQYGIELRGRF